MAQALAPATQRSAFWEGEGQGQGEGAHSFHTHAHTHTLLLACVRASGRWLQESKHALEAIAERSLLLSGDSAAGVKRHTLSHT